MSVLTKDGETVLAGAGLAAVPVRISAAARSALDHRIVGMLKIEEIDPAAFGCAVLPALEAIAHALAPRLEALLVQNGQLPFAPTTPSVVQTDSSGRRLLRHFRWFGRGQPQGNLATEDASDQTKSRVTV